jgi:glycerol kinase
MTEPITPKDRDRPHVRRDTPEPVAEALTDLQKKRALGAKLEEAGLAQPKPQAAKAPAPDRPPRFVAAIDQGTTSTRFMVFDHTGGVVAVDQKEHEQIYPRPGWVEHNPLEIWERTRTVIAGALRKHDLDPKDLAAVGVTNQRETTVVWDKSTGQPIHNAIVWQDTRTADICAELAGDGGQDRFRAQTGLPLATYFSGPKIKWILDNVEGARARAERGELLFGNVDTWLIWNLTGGPRGGVHVTDVSNASRTLLMNLETLDWDEAILNVKRVPRAMLPAIRASSEIYGAATGLLEGVPVSSDLGDQQAALFGQTCFSPGEAKNTYGTGCFMLLNTGASPIPSKNGLLTTLAYRIGNEKAVYALEGSIAITGALVQWLRDNLGLIQQSADVEALARSVDDSGGIYFVPAFSGLYAPYWKDNARGAIVGLTRYIHKGHLARAALEATAYQTREVLDAMNKDSGVSLTALKVDGGMVRNELLMQFQADLLGVPVIRPTVAETTSLGAAYAAGLAVGFWERVEDLRANWGKDKEWTPQMDAARRERLYAGWKKAVTRTFDWVE